MTTTRLLLVGGGHSHVEVLRRFAEHPVPATEVTLVSTEPWLDYTGMLPGLVAGHYQLGQTRIGLPALARAAGARFVAGHVVGLNLYTKLARLANGAMEPFDGLSLDVGAATGLAVPGADAHAIPLKPFAEFLQAWESLRRDIAEEKVRTIAVVGGGAGGIEILLAMRWRFTVELGAAAPRFILITDTQHLLPEHAPTVRRHAANALVKSEVMLKTRTSVASVEPGALVTSAGVRIAADRIIWATGAAPQRWLAAAGLDCDENGFVKVDDHLQSTSHPFVFASGDCSSQVGRPHPRSGVYAVRQGPVLAGNLYRAVRHEPLRPFLPRRHALALISTGGKHAIASRGIFCVQGDWVWRWKDRIDREFIARYSVANVP